MSNIYIQEPPTSGKVVMKTSVGDIDLELWTREAPKACRNFIQLCMEGYYDNTIFHRVVKGFIVQGGDPTGTGEGGESIYGEPFKDEFHTRLRFCRRGLLAMANAGKNDNGSQFFFTLAATQELQNKHTIFGKVTGETIYNMIKLEDALVDENDRPVYPQKILKTEILSNPFDDIVPRVVPKQKSEEEKPKKKSKKGVKDFKLLSFGEEAEEDEEETVALSKKLESKSKSAHDTLADPKLSSQPVIDLNEPSAKKSKTDGSDDSASEDDSQTPEEKNVTEKEKNEMTERIKNKLKGSTKDSSKNKVENSKKTRKDDNESEEEEYYLGKDRNDELKRKTEEIKKEIRDFKRQMKNEKDKKTQEENKKEEEKIKKEQSSELIKEYQQTQEKYKEESSKIPKKGASRESFTAELLNKFKNQVMSVQELHQDSDDDKKDEIDDDKEDPNDTSWMSHTLKCEDKAPVLAKDASTKGDDWFEIYDPRNPINKRRRGETGEKSKPGASKKNRR